MSEANLQFYTLKFKCGHRLHRPLPHSDPAELEAFLERKRQHDCAHCLALRLRKLSNEQFKLPVPTIFTEVLDSSCLDEQRKHFQSFFLLSELWPLLIEWYETETELVNRIWRAFPNVFQTWFLDEALTAASKGDNLFELLNRLLRHSNEPVRSLADLIEKTECVLLFEEALEESSFTQQFLSIESLNQLTPS